MKGLNTEHHVAAKLEYEMKMRGSRGFAYVPVVAGGRNGLVLHYVFNDEKLRYTNLFPNCLFNMG